MKVVEKILKFLARWVIRKKKMNYYVFPVKEGGEWYLVKIERYKTATEEMKEMEEMLKKESAAGE